MTLADIRELDSERQALVYNHHHELIDASDTIRKVRDLRSFDASPWRGRSRDDIWNER